MKCVTSVLVFISIICIAFCVLLQQADGENEQKKKQEQLMMEKLLEQEAMMEEQESQQVCAKYIYAHTYTSTRTNHIIFV